MAENADSRIVHGVSEAILERRLRAGTKLSEPELCEIYDCSRTDVRRALVVLATRKTVESRGLRACAQPARGTAGRHCRGCRGPADRPHRAIAPDVQSQYPEQLAPRSW
ncbi:GntR family transcriptional regulator [Paracoccus actinidiae]|uniref:GntR family transcriptional regulator n=1 Tax=Paracoccus actinidiae TaxID=3064531 RepID=UPI00359C41AA